MLELTGEIADGWLGTSFVPEGASAYFTHLDAGLARAGRRRADLDICQGAEINLVDEADLAATVAGRKKELAFSLGGMGSATGQLLQRRLQPPGLGGGRRPGPRALAGRGPRRRGRPGHRRDGPRDHADRHRRTWCAPGCGPGATSAWTPCASTRPETPSPPAWTTSAGASTWSGRQELIIPNGAYCVPRPAAVSRTRKVSAGSSLTCRYMSNPVRLSSRLTMGWQPVMISSRPCPAWLSCAHARTARPAQSVKPSADRSATRVFGARSRASADGLPQVVRAADVELALEPQH